MPLVSQLLAIDDVEIQAPRDVQPELIWFYGELMGLPLADNCPGDDEVLRFKSEGLELRITLLEHPRVDSIACRVLAAVPSLFAVAEALNERRYDYQWFHGVYYTDRSLSLLDPAGNRVVLRRNWPVAMF